MEKTKIPFNYFYNNFRKKFYDYITGIKSSRLTQNDDEHFNQFIPTNEEKYEIYKSLLYEMCCDYVTYSGSSIEVYPVDVYEFVDVILNSMFENDYKESFLMSLQFIYKDIIECLGLGEPMLGCCETEDGNQYFQIIMDSKYSILDFEANNLDLLEQAKIINKIVIMESNKQIGPHPYVLYRYRKDI